MVGINNLPNEILGPIISQVIHSTRRRNQSPVLYACVCRRWQSLVECHTLELVRLRPSPKHPDLAMFRLIFSTDQRRKRCLRRIDIDFDLRATRLDLPENYCGSEEERAILAMIYIYINFPPHVALSQFEAQLTQDNIRMTILLAEIFRFLAQWSQEDTESGVLLRFITENPTY